MNITGIWSVDLQYSPGAASDDILAFFPDGRGYYAEYNWALCGYETFDYRVVREGVIELTGNHAYYNDGHHRFTEEFEHYVGPKFLSYRISEGESPVEGKIPFLHLAGFSVNRQTKFGFARAAPPVFEEPYGVNEPAPENQSG